MFQIFGINSSQHVHFIGIGGISMSSLATILKQQGFTVTGTDITRTHITDKLESLGIQIYIGHKAENISGADLIVYTAAIKKDNPEYIAAQNSNALCVERSVFLGELMRAYRCPCCISGTHGKTTTTSMVALIMEQAQMDPTVLVGGEVKALGGNLRIGNSDIFVTEACEYVESFLKFYPQKAIILNVEADHLDYFKDLNHIVRAFTKFASLLPKEGDLIVNGMDQNAMRAASNAACRISTFGIGESYDYCAKNIIFDSSGYGSYDLIAQGNKIAHIKLGVPGKHNILNSLAASALCHRLGVDGDRIAEGLSNFRGTDRRFEIKGEYNGVLIVDDYAHHPTEIKVTLETAKNYGHKKITAIFQSHTYTRTKALLHEFADAFTLADKVIVTDIFAAREKDTGLVHPTDLVNLLIENGKDAIYIGPFDDIVSYIKKNTAPGEMVITVGAGNIYEVGEKLVKSSQ